MSAELCQLYIRLEIPLACNVDDSRRLYTTVISGQVLRERLHECVGIPITWVTSSTMYPELILLNDAGDPWENGEATLFHDLAKSASSPAPARAG